MSRRTRAIRHQRRERFRVSAVEPVVVKEIKVAYQKFQRAMQDKIKTIDVTYPSYYAELLQAVAAERSDEFNISKLLERFFGFYLKLPDRTDENVKKIRAELKSEEGAEQLQALHTELNNILNRYLATVADKGKRTSLTGSIGLMNNIINFNIRGFAVGLRPSH